jgi:hypothetical protein
VYTKAEPLWYFKFQLSKNETGSRFSHTVVDKLPCLHYRFALGSNWTANDYRVTTKMKEVETWFDNYWETKETPSSIVNRGLYEKELELAITEAYKNLNEKWNKKVEADFEKHFDDDLLGFMSGKKQNS